MEDLTALAPRAHQGDRGDRGREVERGFERRGGEARDTRRVVERERAELHRNPRATTVQSAAEATEDEAERDDRREDVAGGGSQTDERLAAFDPGVAADQPAEDRLAVDEERDRVRACEDPRELGEDVGELRAEERSREPSDVDQREPRIPARQARPRERGARDGDDEEERVPRHAAAIVPERRAQRLPSPPRSRSASPKTSEESGTVLPGLIARSSGKPDGSRPKSGMRRSWA